MEEEDNLWNERREFFFFLSLSLLPSGSTTLAEGERRSIGLVNPPGSDKDPFIRSVHTSARL